MNWDRIEGNWRQLKGKAKEQWGKLTDDEFDRIAGKRDQLVGRIQENYGITQDEADKQVRAVLWVGDLVEAYDEPFAALEVRAERSR